MNSVGKYFCSIAVLVLSLVIVSGCREEEDKTIAVTSVFQCDTAAGTECVIGDSAWTWLSASQIWSLRYEITKVNAGRFGYGKLPFSLLEQLTNVTFAYIRQYSCPSIDSMSHLLNSLAALPKLNELFIENNKDSCIRFPLDTNAFKTLTSLHVHVTELILPNGFRFMNELQGLGVMSVSNLKGVEFSVKSRIKYLSIALQEQQFQKVVDEVTKLRALEHLTLATHCKDSTNRNYIFEVPKAFYSLPLTYLKLWCSRPLGIDAGQIGNMRTLEHICIDSKFSPQDSETRHKFRQLPKLRPKLFVNVDSCELFENPFK